MTEKWKIGTSGWNYRHWKELFYPSGLPVSKWLDFYSMHFTTVEVNSTFYRLPKPETFERWHDGSPQNFIWALKASRFITHIKRLKDCRDSLEILYSRASRLKNKLGPILFQLPPNLIFDNDTVSVFCKQLDQSYRHVFEIRHPSWVENNFFEILKAHNIAFCISDTAGRYPYNENLTSDFIYIRLHGGKKLYSSEYSESELQEWANKIRGWGLEGYIYFDNDFSGFAVKNAKRLQEIFYPV